MRREGERGAEHGTSTKQPACDVLAKREAGTRGAARHSIGFPPRDSAWWYSHHGLPRACVRSTGGFSGFPMERKSHLQFYCSAHTQFCRHMPDSGRERGRCLEMERMKQAHRQRCSSSPRRFPPRVNGNVPLPSQTQLRPGTRTPERHAVTDGVCGGVHRGSGEGETGTEATPIGTRRYSAARNDHFRLSSERAPNICFALQQAFSLPSAPPHHPCPLFLYVI